MQEEELYVIMLHIAEESTPQRVCYIGDCGGIFILRETLNCWYAGSPPHGLPERFRKSEEYKLLNNRFGICMFGRDSVKKRYATQLLIDGRDTDLSEDAIADYITECIEGNSLKIYDMKMLAEFKGLASFFFVFIWIPMVGIVEDKEGEAWT